MIDENVEILVNECVAENTFLLVFRSRGIADSAVPGQFVMVRVTDGPAPLLRRPFSICGAEGDSITLLYRKVGAGTSLLAGAAPGGRLRVLGPLGKGFEIPVPEVFPVVVSGGIGAAPVAFLARRLAGGFLWLAGFRTAAEIPPFSRLGLPVENIRISTDDGSAGTPGLVTALLEARLERAGADAVFACGPAPMLRGVAFITERYGGASQFSVEASMACGVGACQGCVVPAAGGGYRRVCVDGPVFYSGDLDWEGL